MLKDITLGQYFPGNSVIHKMDPRAKILIALVFIVSIFLAENIFAFAALALFVIVLVLLSRISIITIFRGIKPILFILLFTAIINLFLTTAQGEEPLWQANISIFSWTWHPTIYRAGILRAVFTALRVVALIVATSVFLTYTTTPITLTDALESLMSPLRVIRVPVHDIAMIITIALRFIPTLIEETDKIMNAQKARGADFANGSLIKRAKALIPVLIPLFVSAFKRADDLAIAMECRCYRGDNGRTKLHKLQFHFRDFIGFAVVLLFAAAILYINYLNPTGIGI